MSTCGIPRRWCDVNDGSTSNKGGERRSLVDLVLGDADRDRTASSACDEDEDEKAGAD
jgi:hypothetical protein